MAIRVECYAGYRSEQEPLALWLGDHRLGERNVVDLEIPSGAQSDVFGPCA